MKTKIQKLLTTIAITASMMLTVGIGEVISCGVFGMILYFALKKSRTAIFGMQQA